MNHASKRKPLSSEADSENSKVVVINAHSPHQPPPSKTAFVPQYQREIWHEDWRNRRVTIATIAIRNKMSRREVESALLDEQDRRDAIRERLLNRRVA